MWKSWQYHSDFSIEKKAQKAIFLIPDILVCFNADGSNRHFNPFASLSVHAWLGLSRGDLRQNDWSLIIHFGASGECHSIYKRNPNLYERNYRECRKALQHHWFDATKSNLRNIWTAIWWIYNEWPCCCFLYDCYYSLCSSKTNHK